MVYDPRKGHDPDCLKNGYWGNQIDKLFRSGIGWVVIAIAITILLICIHVLDEDKDERSPLYNRDSNHIVYPLP